MRWIDVENKFPTETVDNGPDFPVWMGWAEEKWQRWLDKSTQLHQELEKLSREAGELLAQGEIEDSADITKKRNILIDKNCGHWGQLKPWLLALSYGKCWFTEGRDICSYKDVEHFRPKKETKDLDGKERDGYWWLAFDYSNFRAAGNVPNRKKGGWFPLHKDSRCSMFEERCEDSEAHYLLDPIKKTDTDLLAFDEEGNAIPAPWANEWEAERVDTSIKRLKLNDYDALPRERRKVWREVSKTIDLYLFAKSKYKPGINPTPQGTMEEKARKIFEMTRPQAELSSVAIWCVRFRNDPQLIKLVD